MISERQKNKVIWKKWNYNEQKKNVKIHFFTEKKRKRDKFIRLCYHSKKKSINSEITFLSDASMEIKQISFILQ